MLDGRAAILAIARSGGSPWLLGVVDVDDGGTLVHVLLLVLLLGALKARDAATRERTKSGADK